MNSIRYNPKWCKGCGICEAFCPAKAIRFTDGRLEYNGAVCVACRMCQRRCPDLAIEIVVSGDRGE